MPKLVRKLFLEHNRGVLWGWPPSPVAVPLLKLSGRCCHRGKGEPRTQVLDRTCQGNVAGVAHLSPGLDQHGSTTPLDGNGATDRSKAGRPGSGSPGTNRSLRTDVVTTLAKGLDPSGLSAHGQAHLSCSKEEPQRFVWLGKHKRLAVVRLALFEVCLPSASCFLRVHSWV
jgi:hypothetical protein